MKKIIITEENSGRRIDIFLREGIFLNEEITRGEIIRLIKNGEVEVNDKNIKPSYILKEGDMISSQFAVRSSQLIPNPNLKIKIIFQDDNIIAIDKPAGLKVHPSSFAEKDTLVNFLVAQFPEIEKVNDGSAGSEFRPGIVHRLDKDTSGVMVIARNQKSFAELKTLFKDRKVEKKYLAIVYGILENKHGLIEKPLARSSNYKKQIVAGKKTKTKIRPAITEYAVQKEFTDLSMIEAAPKTGRTHQIRIHLFSLGHPVVGDKLYKLKKRTSAAAAKRQLLHAESIEFNLFEKNYAFSSKLPGDIESFLKGID